MRNVGHMRKEGEGCGAELSTMLLRVRRKFIGLIFIEFIVFIGMLIYVFIWIQGLNENMNDNYAWYNRCLRINVSKLKSNIKSLSINYT